MLRKRIKEILFVIPVAFIAIQFIQPVRNQWEHVSQTDISFTFDIPSNVYTLLKNACYDCHSNNTIYPWYSNIQPVAWLMASDIKNGKEKMNFSEFGILSRRKQMSRLQVIENQIKDNVMPLPSYKLMHKNARLNQEDKKVLIDWIDKTIQQESP